MIIGLHDLLYVLLAQALTLVMCTLRQHREGLSAWLKRSTCIFSDCYYSIVYFFTNDVFDVFDAFHIVQAISICGHLTY